MSWVDPWIATLAVLAATVALAAAARRGRRQLIGTTIAALALVALAIARVPIRSGSTAVLLTEGASPSRLADDGWALHPSEPVYTIGSDPSWPRWAETFADAGGLIRTLPTAGSMVVAGHGLEPWDAERLIAGGGDGSERAAAKRLDLIIADVPPDPAGVNRASWRRDLASGRPLLVTGTVTPADGATIRLSGPAGSAEQTLATGESSFKLEIVPPGTGRFLYQLQVEAGDRPYEADPVDVEVRQTPPPALLWLERGPSFETRHVKQWLTTAGGSVAVRSSVSRETYRFEYHNMDRVDISRLTPDRLQPFDLVIVDSTTWADLPRIELTSIEEALAQGTIGLVLRLNLEDGPLEKSPFGVGVRRIAELDRLMVRPTDLRDPVEPIAIPPFELEHLGAPLFEDSAGRVLALRRRFGSGTVVVTAMTDSYRWVLEGRGDVHRSYWLDLLEAAAPPDERARWLLPAGPILAHEPLTVTLTGELPTYSYLIGPSGERAEIPMRQHPTRLDRSSATLWPRDAGWHRLVADDAVASFYVAGASSWQSWRMVRRRDATALAATRLGSTTGPPTAAPWPWPRLMALVILLAGLTYIWIDERRRA